ncbi:STAS domain-containing protein [Thiomicrorhabdus aquaedulcis]|uniref:STAS domain-containing protein n=1 Tax=Thiomicrorhabdus aquaedulcis TaxID=2211106 RepID=UPI000FDB495F|nr:STAS domain-containing protein [Thiomicrorhabdus aquaedulcis]
MSLNIKEKNNVVTIAIEGSFDVSGYQAFKEVIETHNDPQTHFIVECKHASYLDSSALGMLLLLREKTAGDQKRLKLVNVHGDVASILKIAQFDRLFSINP